MRRLHAHTARPILRTKGRDFPWQGDRGLGKKRGISRVLDKLEMFIALANERHFGAAADL